MKTKLKKLIYELSKERDRLTELLYKRGYDEYFDGFNDCLIEVIDKLTKLKGVIK